MTEQVLHSKNLKITVNSKWKVDGENKLYKVVL